jgi:hypothetical protein
MCLSLCQAPRFEERSHSLSMFGYIFKIQNPLADIKGTGLQHDVFRSSVSVESEVCPQITLASKVLTLYFLCALINKLCTNYQTVY